MDVKVLLSDYFRNFLESISYELTDVDKVYIVNTCCNKIDQHRYLKEIADTAVDIEIADKLYALIRYEEYLSELFACNNGEYVYVIADHSEYEEILGVFMSFDVAREFGYLNLSQTDSFNICKYPIKKEATSVMAYDFSVCECKKGCIPVVIQFDCCTYEKNESYLKKCNVDNYCFSSGIPCPFRDGDIIWGDVSYGERYMGVVDNSRVLLSCEDEKSDAAKGKIGIKYYRTDSDDVLWDCINPFTAEPVTTCYDFNLWRRLNELSVTIKNKEKQDER